MENYNTQKPSLFTLLKKAWNEWRAESKDSKRMREYMEVISLHSKKTGSFGRADHESGVMQAYFRACKAKEAEVAKNVRAMVFGATDQEKDSLKASLMSLGIDLDSIMGEADAVDGLTPVRAEEYMKEVMSRHTKKQPLADRDMSEFNASAARTKRLQDAQGIEPKIKGAESAGEAYTNDKTYENERAAYKEMLDSQKVTYDEVPDPDPKNTRKAIYVDIGDMSREEAEEYIDRLMKQHKINTKPLYDPRKYVSGATTDDMPFNSLWPEVIYARSLEETIKTLVTGETTPQPEPLPPDPKMEEYVQAIHENVIVPSAKSLEELPITVFTGDKEPQPEFEKPIPEIGLDNAWAYDIGKPVADVEFKQEELAENEKLPIIPTVVMPKEEKEYIEAAVAVLDDPLVEPSSSSEEQKT